VAELAAESHISRSAFAERFQTTIGVPPLRYATEVKMHLAVRWLSSENITVDTASQRLGYSSQAAFSRAFKRVTGKSPGAVRLLS
jgi:AraC-like DNA-binding protein